MNQILDIKNKNRKFNKFFKLQFIISFASLLVLFVYILNENNSKIKEEKITNVIMQNAKILSLFESKSIEMGDENGIYFCKLKIEKIDLEYFVYETYSDELLKILPCKFYGENIDNDGNICIIGHNYFDDRFFGNLDKLEINDKIILENLEGKVYNYYVYEISVIEKGEISEVINRNENVKEVTLCTCTFSKDKRLIVKAREEV